MHIVPHVVPSDWRTNPKSIKKPWYIWYRIGSKLINIRGMNHLKDHAERVACTQNLIDNIVPPTSSWVKETSDTNAITLPRALQYAYEKVRVSEKTLQCIASTIKYVTQVIDFLGYKFMPVKEISRKHIRSILDECEKHRKFSARSWNAYRTYLYILFEELKEHEIINSNPVKDVSKREEEQSIRELLTDKQRKLLVEYLTETDPIFLRFIQIFFHSGARRSELLSLRIEQVYLEKSYYQVYVKKGRKKRWVTKVIKDIAMPYWREQIGSNISGYVFSVGLLPGTKKIRDEQVTRRWKRHVKDKLGITADLYSLKHLNTDEMSEQLSLAEAAKHNSHSIQMARKHYAVNESIREMNRVKKLKNQL